MKEVELLAPAGSLERLKWAFLYGADAVYMGSYKYNLRANAQNFSMEELKLGCIYAHNLNKKVYVTVNFVFHTADCEGLMSYLKELEVIGVDAIIISDLFIIDIINKNNIKLDVHISTQASIANKSAVQYFENSPVTRVILARELSHDEIKEIISNTSLEIETFIHGAMCSGYSGRCVLSNYLTKRDANRGGCAQVCRFLFNIETSQGKHNNFMIASKDLCLIPYLDQMIDIGIKSFKIEGRMRSNYYVATVVNTYRRAIDEYLQYGKFNKEKYLKILSRCANRESTTQFYKGYVDENDQYYDGRCELTNQDFLAIVVAYDDSKHEVTVSQRNYFQSGDVVTLMSPSNEEKDFIVPTMYDEDKEAITVARHPKQILKFKLDIKVNVNDIIHVKF